MIKNKFTNYFYADIQFKFYFSIYLFISNKSRNSMNIFFYFEMNYFFDIKMNYFLNILFYFKIYVYSYLRKYQEEFII